MGGVDGTVPGLAPLRAGVPGSLRLPFGAGLFFLGISAVLPEKVGAVAFILAAVCNLVGFVYLVATIFVKDRWYPRWYHGFPPEERKW